MTWEHRRDHRGGRRREGASACDCCHRAVVGYWKYLGDHLCLGCFRWALTVLNGGVFAPPRHTAR